MAGETEGKTSVVDVAIVGAGVAGLYAGWSLLSRANGLSAQVGDRPLRVTILEAGVRLGGRLYSARPPHAPHLTCELGGMRYIDTQDMVVDLIAELGLASHVFPVGDENNLHYLRGTRFSLAELTGKSHPIPYAVSAGEAGKTPSQLLSDVLHGFVPGGETLDNSRKIGLERTMTFNGQSVVDTPAIHVLRDLLSPEAYDFIVEGMGYTCILDDEISAVNLIHTDLKGGTWRTLDEGMQALPLAIADRFKRLGGTIALNHDVTGLSRGEGEQFVLTANTPDGEAVVRAGRVILALPAAALKALDLPTVLPNAPFLARDLDAVVPVPAAKLYLGFNEPWWERIGLSEGRTVTDLPIRQCLYFGVESERGGTDPSNRSALLVASYSDGDATRYWEKRVGEPPFYPCPDDFPDTLSVSADVVKDVCGQLEAVHGTSIDTPEWAAFVDWTLPPFCGGWHYWRVGHRSVDVIGRLRKPDAKEHVYICGEAYSSHQAWILGALSSTERVLQEYFGAAPPAWLRPGADIGA